jgi:hypothetical protein
VFGGGVRRPRRSLVERSRPLRAVTRSGKKLRPEPLGIHGLVFSSARPASLARRWIELTGLKPLRRSRSEIVLGGPELFVVVRKRRAISATRLEEVHIAVEEIAVTRRKTLPDPLGGDSWKRMLGDLALVVREFRRPPARAALAEEPVVTTSASSSLGTWDLGTGLLSVRPRRSPRDRTDSWCRAGRSSPSPRRSRCKTFSRRARRSSHHIRNPGARNP